MAKTRFREYCIEQKWTAEFVAEAIGCSKSAVYAYFRGERFPSRRTKKRMEEVLGIDTRSMFGI